MVKIVLTNNAGAAEKIVDENKSVRTIMEENGFTYSGATLNIDGRAIPDALIDEPLGKFVSGLSNTVRVTAVAHKANA